MKKVLPVSTPYITHTPEVTAVFSILTGYAPAEEWLCTTFYPMGFYCENYEDEIVWTSHRAAAQDACPFLFYSEESISVDQLNPDQLLAGIKGDINRGYYISVPVNTSYISAYSFPINVIHLPLIYGYDDEKKIFYIIDHFKNGKMSFAICSYSELSNALEYLANGDNCFNYQYCQRKMKLNEDAHYIMDKNLIQERLSDFYLGTNLYLKYTNGKTFYNDCDFEQYKFGSKFYDIIAELILKPNSVNYLKKPIYLLMAHAKIFHKLTYLILNRYKVDYTELSRRQIDKAQIILSKFLKLSFLPENRKSEYAKMISTDLLSLRDYECSLIHGLLLDFQTI